MSDMTDVFSGALNIAGNFLDSDLLSRFMTAVFAVILVFGILNCVLGYRLLRFWMMLGGFFVGAGLAFVTVHGMGVAEKSTWLLAMVVTGIIFAVIAFLVYKAGVFLLAAGIGWAASIYFLHPTSSAVFFACILIGIALGSMAVKYCREVLIVATSLIGGIMAGVSLAKLGNLADIPYGLGMSIGFAVLGILVQLAINKPHSEDEEDRDDKGGDDKDQDEETDEEQKTARVNARIRRMQEREIQERDSERPRKSARPQTQRSVSTTADITIKKNGRKS